MPKLRSNSNSFPSGREATIHQNARKMWICARNFETSLQGSSGLASFRIFLRCWPKGQFLHTSMMVSSNCCIRDWSQCSLWDPTPQSCYAVLVHLNPSYRTLCVIRSCPIHKGTMEQCESSRWLTCSVRTDTHRANICTHENKISWFSLATKNRDTSNQ